MILNLVNVEYLDSDVLRRLAELKSESEMNGHFDARWFDELFCRQKITSYLDSDV